MQTTLTHAANQLEGWDKVMKNLNAEIMAIEGRTQAGLIKASIIVRRDMDKTPPKIPIDTGNLRASWFVSSVHGEEPTSETNHNYAGKTAGVVASDTAVAIAESRGLLPSDEHTPAIAMGFGANYALFVHENVNADFTSSRRTRNKKTKKVKFTKRRAGAGAKFFEASLNRNHDEILKTIADNAKIK